MRSEFEGDSDGRRRHARAGILARYRECSSTPVPIRVSGRTVQSRLIQKRGSFRVNTKTSAVVASILGRRWRCSEAAVEALDVLRHAGWTHTHTVEASGAAG